MSKEGKSERIKGIMEGMREGIDRQKLMHGHEVEREREKGPWRWGGEGVKDRHIKIMHGHESGREKETDRLTSLMGKTALFSVVPFHSQMSFVSLHTWQHV